MNDRKTPTRPYVLTEHDAAGNVVGNTRLVDGVSQSQVIHYASRGRFVCRPAGASEAINLVRDGTPIESAVPPPPPPAAAPKPAAEVAPVAAELPFAPSLLEQQAAADELKLKAAAAAIPAAAGTTLGAEIARMQASEAKMAATPKVGSVVPVNPVLAAARAARMQLPVDPAK